MACRRWLGLQLRRVQERLRDSDLVRRHERRYRLARERHERPRRELVPGDERGDSVPAGQAAVRGRHHLDGAQPGGRPCLDHGRMVRPARRGLRRSPLRAHGKERADRPVHQGRIGIGGLQRPGVHKLRGTPGFLRTRGAGPEPLCGRGGPADRANAGSDHHGDRQPHGVRRNQHAVPGRPGRPAFPGLARRRKPQHGVPRGNDLGPTGLAPADGQELLCALHCRPR